MPPVAMVTDINWTDEFSITLAQHIHLLNNNNLSRNTFKQELKHTESKQMNMEQTSFQAEAFQLAPDKSACTADEHVISDVTTG